MNKIKKLNQKIYSKFEISKNSMDLEIERKFLLAKPPPGLLAMGNPEPIQQGYIAWNAKGELRVRIDVMLNLYYSRIVPFLDGGYVEP